ncbi:MAG: hypothetical protein PWQ96_1032 [Clostridia bacterium]|jgi:DNA-dependent RNA polymerase auxiliary subunit epsilon|nr:hypothetical protein [Clostridiales bacterium]MDK2985390.1 hypothetical protein [Clostridia bacterium]
MKVYFLKNSSFLKAGAIFIIGVIIGAAALNAVIGKKLDELYRENTELKEDLSATKSELEEVQTSLKKRRYTVVSIDPVITFKDELTEYEKETATLEIQKNIKEMLKNLIGKEVGKLNYFLIPTVVDNRVIEIDGKSYKIKVSMVVVTQKIIIYTDVKLTTT